MIKRYLLITIFSVIIFLAILASRATGSHPPDTSTPASPSPDQVSPVENTVVTVENRTLNSSTPESFVTQEKSPSDGLALLKRHCTQCHTAQLFDEIEKSRGEWEESMVQMEVIGVRMEDFEKAVLLDFLAASDQP